MVTIWPGLMVRTRSAPAALRAAGLVDALVRAGLVVRDDGDCATWRWRPDREPSSCKYDQLDVAEPVAFEELVTET